MLGVIVNTLAVIAGSSIGLLGRKGIPEKFSTQIMLAIGICTLFIGIQGGLKGENILVAILSMCGGVAIGTALDLDGKINYLGELTEKHFTRNRTNEKKGAFAQGLVTAFLLWCVGSMTIVGSLQAGVAHDYSMLYTKSLLDLISAVMLASSLGIGVMFAAVPLFLFQGALVLLAGLIEPLLTSSMINEIVCVGSLTIMALGLNLINVTEFKVANFLPAVILVPFAVLLLGVFGI